MGLGKTLSALALISWFLDTFDQPDSELHMQQRTTLIITPKSSETFQVLCTIAPRVSNPLQPFTNGNNR